MVEETPGFFNPIFLYPRIWRIYTTYNSFKYPVAINLYHFPEDTYDTWFLYNISLDPYTSFSNATG